MAEKSKGWLPIAGLGVLALIGVCVAAVMILRGGGEGIDDQLEAIRERGEPTSLQELNEFYAEPAGANAADEYIQAQLLLEQLTPEERAIIEDRLLPTGEPVFPTDGTAYAQTDLLVQELFDELAPVRSLIADAVATGDARFPVDFTALRSGEATYFIEMRKVIWYMLFDAAVHAREGDADNAVDSLLLAFGSIRAVNEVPDLLAHAIQVVLLQACVEETAQLIPLVSLSDSQLNDLSSAIRDCYSNDSPRRALIGEQAFFLDPNAEMVDAVIFKRDYRRLLTELEGLIRVTDLPLHEIPNALMRFQSSEQLGTWPDLLYIFTNMTIPGLARSLETFVDAAILQELGILVCDIERLRQPDGSLPNGIADVIPNIPRDPYSDGPLRLAIDDTGYTVYSVGMNGIDESGDPSSDDIQIRINR